jgi:Family of unknown function (DUF6941)
LALGWYEPDLWPGKGRYAILHPALCISLIIEHHQPFTPMPTPLQPTRILPDLQCSLLCEEIRQEVTGNFILIGVINLLYVPQVPVVASRLSLFNRWTAGLGQFIETSRFIAPDQTTVLRKGEVKFALQDAALHATNFTVFGQVELKVTGTYYVEVLVDDVMKLRYPVPVVIAPRPPQPGQAPGPQTQTPG